MAPGPALEHASELLTALEHEPTQAVAVAARALLKSQQELAVTTEHDLVAAELAGTPAPLPPTPSGSTLRGLITIKNCTGLAQIEGKVQAADRDSQSKYWAKSCKSGQPGANHFQPTGFRALVVQAVAFAADPGPARRYQRRPRRQGGAYGRVEGGGGGRNGGGTR